MHYAITNNSTHIKHPLLRLKEGMYTRYLNKNLEVMEYAVRRYGRVFALRFELRIPSEYNYDDTNLITRFVSSLKAQFTAEYQRKVRQSHGGVHTTEVIYIWTREEGKYGKPHYHLCIFLNGNAYHSLGEIELGRVNIYNKLVNAWKSALNTHHTPDCDWKFDPHLVSMPPNCEYWLERGTPGFNSTYRDLYKRLSYFAKVTSKPIGDGVNCYGTSRLSKAAFQGV